MPFKKNVFILGAGASADAGAPLMHSFLRRARDLMDDQRSSLTGDERQSFQRVFQYLYELRRAQALVNVDLDNIEDLFGVIDLEARVEKEHADRTRDDLVRLIIKTLDLTIQPQRTYILNPRTGQDYGEPDLTVHGHFARIVLRTPLTDLDSRQALCPESDSVITFNYDTL